MNIENQFITIISSALSSADDAFVEDFVTNGPIPGGRDGGSRYLLAVAMRDITASQLADITGVSLAVAQNLLRWLNAGTCN
jgi:hypothetical protein